MPHTICKTLRLFTLNKENMVQISIRYTGDKHCELIHEPSRSKIGTDAPKDNNGRGELFSPTDLVAAAMGSCVLTTMAIFAEKENIDIRGSHARVGKEMKSDPRRIGRLSTEIHLPAALSTENRKRLEEVGKNCPVKRSLDAAVETPTEFIYDL